MAVPSLVQLHHVTGKISLKQIPAHLRSWIAKGTSRGHIHAGRSSMHPPQPQSLCKLLPICLCLTSGYEWFDLLITEILTVIAVGVEIWNDFFFSPIQVHYFFCWLLLESWSKHSLKFFCLSYKRLETLLVNHSDLGIWSPFAIQHLFCLTFPQSQTAASARLSTEFWSWSLCIS